MMKKTISRWVIIGVTFIAALIFFSLYFNNGMTDMTKDMTMPSLPVAYINIDGYKVNEMHGYLTPMDASEFRDSVTPVGDDRAVTFVVDKYGAGISNIRIEVRSADGNRLIEDTNIIQYSDYNETLETTVNLKDLIEKGREYNLILVLTLSDGRTVYYYTRIIQKDNINAGAKIEFAKDFCQKTFSKDNIKELSVYMESNSQGDNTSLGNVGIHSSMNQLTWANLEPTQETAPTIMIREIGDTMASIELKYLVSSKENKIVHYYNVTEYYRIRITNQRTYLLSFNRNMDEIFVMDKTHLVNDKVMLGIQSAPIQMMESEDGEVLVFENDGRLYSYNNTDNKLVRLFAFYDTTDDDYRSRYRGNNVKILDVEENGNVAFIVYGYMCRGIHEGEVGVAVYYHNSALNTIEEQVFIPYNGYQDILKCDVEKLSYLNTAGQFYVFIDGVVYHVDPTNLKYTVVAENINESTFFASKSGKTIVWQDLDKNNQNDIASDLTVMSLQTGKSNNVSRSASEYVRPIGFMNEDLIYGICRRADLLYNRMGDVTFPMYKVVIQEENGTVLKEYEEDGIYVTAGSIENNQITLSRIKRISDGNKYETVLDDHITSNVQIEEGKNGLAMVATDLYEKIVQVQLKSIVDSKSLKMLTPKEVIYEGGRGIKLKNQDKKTRFVVYGDGDVVGIYDKPAQAVIQAYGIRGTVMDTYGNEIYRRGETVSRNQIMAISEASTTETKNSLAVCLDTMLKLQGVSRNTEYQLDAGKSVYDILATNLGNVYVLNLTGCTMDMMLYYVNLDIPVLSILSDGSAVLIIGFNEQNVVLMDPEEGTIYKKGMNDSREWFEENGNRFMTYAIRYDEE